MNIAYVFSSRWPGSEAGLSFTTYTCYGLAKADKENNIYFVVAKNTAKEPSKVMEEYFSVDMPDNLDIKLIDNKSFIAKTVKFYFKAYKNLVKMIKDNQLDAVITRTVSFLPWLYLLKKRFGIKVFFEAHNFYLEEKRKSTNQKWKRSLLQKTFLPRLDGIICHQNELIKLYRQHISEQNYCMARTGIRKIINQDNLWENEYLGYIGSIDSRKRVEDILYVLREIKDEQLKLLIVGGKKQERVDEFLQLAADLGIKDRVQITGWVSRDKVEDYLKQIKIGLVPLEDNFFNRSLTSPMKIFNYFSHGIPIIGSDLPTVREIVSEECGLFYNNRKELVANIDKLTSSKELFETFSTNILNRAENLLWEQRGRNIINFIELI